MKWARVIAISVVSLLPAAIARADGAPATQPTTVTLHMEDADAREVLRRIAAAAHMEIQLFPPWMWSGTNGSPVTIVSVNFDHEPFWQAVAEFCKVAHCSVNQGGFGSGTLQFQQSYNNQDNGMLGGVMDASGPYAVVAQSIRRSATTALATGRVSHDDCIQLSLFIDPALRLVMTSRPWLEVAEDDQGQSMVPTQKPDASINAAMYSSTPWQTNSTAELKFPEHAGRRLATVSGHWLVEVPAEIQTLTINDVQKAVNKKTTVGDYSMTITSCRLNGASGQIAMNVSRAPQAPVNPVLDHVAQMVFGIPQQPRRPDYLMYKLQGAAITLVDANGKIADVNGGGGGGVDEVQWQVSVSSQPQSDWGKPPIKLVWKIVTQTEIRSVDFHFKDLPLPQE
jgi:hypothetical protein